MKKGYFLLISILALLWTGCSYEAETFSSTNGRLTVKLEIENINTGVESATRAAVPAEANEENVADIHLLFFDYKSTGLADASGAWVATVAAPGLTLENPNFVIDYDAVPALDATKEYVILALANLEGYLPGGETVADLLPRMETMTEKEALEETQLIVQGVGTNETDNSRRILPGKLPMSARTVVSKGAADATIKLSRGVARFDVEIVPENYTLVSASIWGAAANAMLWDDMDFNATDRLQRFYGVKTADADGFIVKDDATGVYKGGLYAFENYVATPQSTDAVTTCVILGLALKSNPADVSYYRVNINLSGAPQNLERNHVYRIRVNSVSGEGEGTEYNAWKQNETKLSFTINDWNLDEGGLVITDGINTLILPAKRVVLDPNGESWYQSVFTKGPGTGTLRITRNSFKGVDAYPTSAGDGIDDINIFLDNNTLRVEAQPTINGEERRGTIELSYAGLRGTITFVQAAIESTFLTLDRYDIPDFLSLGRGGISDNNPIEVTASGPWTATIYNTSEDPYNPGFSFSTTTNPVTVLRSVNNPYRNLFTIYTTGDNPNGNASRSGFVIVSLDEDPDNFQRVIVLTQLGNSGIALSPEVAEGGTIRFSGLGVPQGIANASKEKGFVFTVDAGWSDGVPNPWVVDIIGDSGNNFDVIRNDTDPSLAPDQFRVVANGTNHQSGETLTGTVTINFVGSGSDPVRQIKLAQAPVGLTLTAKGTEVPTIGGLIEGVTVNIDASMQWEATITTNDPNHPGYLWNGTSKVTSLTNQSSTDKLVAGFDKIYYPLVNKSPQMTITVKIKGSTGTTGTATLVVTQEALTPKRVKIMDMKNTGYGSLTSGSYFSYYKSYLFSSALFGNINSKSPMTSGSVMDNLPSSASSDPKSPISGDYVYLHAGGVADSYSLARHTAVYNWWKSYGDEGILVFCNDHASAALFSTPVFQDIHVTYAGSGSGGNNVRLASDQSSLVHDYLLKGRGPFGQVSGLDRTLWNDGISSTAITTDPGSTAIPILSDGAGKTILFIDPVNNVVFIGEGQVFDIYMHAPGTLAGTNGGSNPNNSKFLGNLLAYIVNSAQYGSHFSDLFVIPGLYNQQTALPNWADPY